MPPGRRSWRCCWAGWVDGGFSPGLSSGWRCCALLLAVMPRFEGEVIVRTILPVAAGTFTGTAMATAAMLAPPGQRGRYMQVISLARRSQRWRVCG